MKKILVYSLMILAVLSLSLTARPVHAAAAVSNNFLRLVIGGGPDGNERITWDANVDTSASDPMTVQIEVRLAVTTSPELPPNIVYEKILPAGSFAPSSSGWSLTAAAKDQTGIDTFNLVRTASGYSLEYVDKRATLPDLSYTNTVTVLTVGGETGTGGITMQPSGNIWNGL